MPDTYHLSKIDGTPYCGCMWSGEVQARTIPNSKELPKDGRLCLRCKRRLLGLPITRRMKAQS